MLFALNLPSRSYFTAPLCPRRMTTCAAVALPAAGNKSLYEVLRVNRSASQAEIKTAYRTLAKLHHPDAISRFMESSIASSTDGRDFIEIHNAYSTLSDPGARAVYDFNLNGDSLRPSRRRLYPSRRWETEQCW